MRDTILLRIQQLDMVLITICRPPDASVSIGKFEESLSALKDILTKLDQRCTIFLLGISNFFKTLYGMRPT